MTEEQFNKIMLRLDDTYSLLKDSVSNTANIAPGISKKSEKGIPWSSILKEKQPKNDYERVALVVNFLNSAGTENSMVTNDNIIDFIRENPDDFMNTNEKGLKGVIRNTVFNETYEYIEFVDKKKKKKLPTFYQRKATHQYIAGPTKCRKKEKK